VPDKLFKLCEAIGQCGWARLQNQGRFDFVDMLVLHGRNAVEASSRCNPVAAYLEDIQKGVASLQPYLT
jgi:hypothetical protein